MRCKNFLRIRDLQLPSQYRLMRWKNAQRDQKSHTKTRALLEYSLTPGLSVLGLSTGGSTCQLETLNKLSKKQLLHRNVTCKHCPKACTTNCLILVRLFPQSCQVQTRVPYRAIDGTISAANSNAGLSKLTTSCQEEIDPDLLPCHDMVGPYIIYRLKIHPFKGSQCVCTSSRVSPLQRILVCMY